MKHAGAYRNWTRDDECIPEPTVKNAVLNYARELGGTFTITDIWKPLGLPRTAVNRVLDRALKAGLVTRYKIPRLTARHPSLRGRVPGEVNRSMVFLYTLTQPA